MDERLCHENTWPDNGTRSKVMRSTKSMGIILWGSRIIPDFIPNWSVAVQIYSGNRTKHNLLIASATLVRTTWLSFLSMSCYSVEPSLLCQEPVYLHD